MDKASEKEKRSGEKVDKASEKEKPGIDKADKGKQSGTNRLFKPTAASAAKFAQRKPAGNPLKAPGGNSVKTSAGNPVKTSGRPGLNPGTGLRKSIKRPAGNETVQNQKSQSTKLTNTTKNKSVENKENAPDSVSIESDVSPKATGTSCDESGELKVTGQTGSDQKSAHPGNTDGALVDSAEGVDPEGRSRPSKPAPKPSSEEKRDQTPEISVISTDRGASTPTGDTPENILDAWDASQIVGVNKTQHNLNETQADPCVSLSEKFAMPKPVFTKSINSRTSVKKPLTVQKGRKSMMPASSAKGVPATVAKLNLTTVQEPEDPDAISDELLEQAHCRYIQSLYLKHITQQIKEKTAKECEEKLLASWTMLEQERQEVIKLEEELAKVNLIADIQAIVNSMEVYFGDSGTEKHLTLFGQINAAKENLLELSRSLDHIKHNIEIKGIRIEKENRNHIAKELMKRIHNFVKLVKSGTLVCPEMTDSIQMLERFKEDAKSMLDNLQECHKLIEQCRRLATKEVSLRISFGMVEEAKRSTSQKHPLLPSTDEPLKVEEIEDDVSTGDNDLKHGIDHKAGNAVGENNFKFGNSDDDEEDIDVKIDLRRSFDGLQENIPDRNFERSNVTGNQALLGGRVTGNTTS